jgi:hypothetical protein
LAGRLGGRIFPSLLGGLAVLSEPRMFFTAVGLSLFNWVISLFQYYTLMLAFFPGGQPLWAAFSLGVAALGIAVPSSPGAVGVLELALVGALAVFGLDSSAALAFAITAHVIQYLWTGLLGAYALGREGETLAGLYRRASRLARGQGAGG